MIANALVLAAVIVAGGKSEYAIVAGTNGVDAVAADELQEVVERSTGVKLPIVASGNPVEAKKRIFIGYIPEAKSVFGADDLASDEYAVTEKGKRLGLFGGGDIWMRGRTWRGSVTAVSAFCEDVLGYRNFYPHEGGERIVKTDIIGTKGYSIRRKEAFPLQRGLCMTYLYAREHLNEFIVRNGGYLPLNRCYKGTKYERYTAPFAHKDSGHGFWLYITNERNKSFYPWDEPQDFFAQHPEWRSMNAAKQRIGGQLCFSNKELRKAFTKRVLERCRKVGGEGILTIGANDVPGPFCWCPDCRALEKKYETPGGAYYDYLPELCEAVRKEFPDIRITTLAYRKEQTENFPKGIERYPENFVCDFAPVDDTQASWIGGKGNEKTLANLKAWCKACSAVTYWYYACTSSQPYGPVSRVTGDLRTISEAGVTGVSDCGIYSPGGLLLLDYLFLRMSLDPAQDPWVRVKEFCDHTYGAASEDVQSVIRDWDGIWFTPNQPFVSIDVGPKSMTIYKAEDIIRWQAVLRAAAEKVAADPILSRNLSWVRWDVDLLALTFWEKIAAVKGRPGWLTPDWIWDRMKVTALPKIFRSEVPKKNEDPRGKYAEAYSAYLLTKAVGKPLPAELANLPKDVVVHTLPQCGGSRAVFDEAALCGGAKSEIFPTNLSYYVYTQQKVGFDFYDVRLKRMIKHGELDFSGFKPDVFKLYCLGTDFKIVPGALITFASWWGIGEDLTNYYPEGDAERKFEIWANLKFIGPQFGTETKDGRNRMVCDAIYLVDRNGKKYKGE